MNAFIPLVTFTSVTTFENCPKQSAFIAQATPYPFRGAAVMGNAVHAAAEQSINTLRAGRWPNLEDLNAALELAARTWEPFMQAPTPADDLTGLIEQGRRSLELFYRHLLPTLARRDELQAERPVRLHLSDEQGTVQVSGRLDVTFLNPQGRRVVLDLKTGPAHPQRRSPQLGVYTAAMRAETGEDAEAFLVHLDPNQPEPVSLAYDATRLNADLADLMTGARALTSAKRFPARPGPLCPYCGYRSRCVEGQAAKPA